jgi:hypothetical protein
MGEYGNGAGDDGLLIGLMVDGGWRMIYLIEEGRF